MTKKKQRKNLIDLSGVIYLRFSNAGRGSVQYQGCRNKKKKIDLLLGPWTLALSYNLDLQHSGTWGSENYLHQYISFLITADFHATVLSQYSKVSRGVCSLISRQQMLLTWVKKLHKTLHKQFFVITWQNNFFLACFDWPRAFDFRISFRKILLALDFDEKLTQNVAQITM